MSSPPLQQDYHLSAVSYQLERLFELKSGSAICAEACQLLDTLQSRQLQTLLQNPPLQDLRALCTLYLLVRHFHPLKLEALDPALLSLLTPFMEAFVPILKAELEELLRQSRVHYYFFVRHLLLREIQFLETVMQVFALQTPTQNVSRNFFLSQNSVYLALLRFSKGPRSDVCPLLWQILNDYGWVQRWQNESQQLQQLPPPRSAPKQEMARYKLSETGKLLMASLEPHDMLAPSFEQALHHHLSQHLKNAVPALNTELEEQLREITQVVMQLAVRKHPAVEKITGLLLDAALSYLPADSPSTRALVLFTLVQEQVLGTQNLKYRLNDSTRGIALSMARLLKAHPDWHDALGWVVSALLDGILEIYESFNLADNALRSFIEAFNQEQEQLLHQEWEREKPAIQNLLRVS